MMPEDYEKNFGTKDYVGKGKIDTTLEVEKPKPGHVDPPLVNKGLDKNGDPIKGAGEPLAKRPDNKEKKPEDIK